MRSLVGDCSSSAQKEQQRKEVEAVVAAEFQKQLDLAKMASKEGKKQPPSAATNLIGTSFAGSSKLARR